MEEEIKNFDRDILGLHEEVETLLKDINGKEERYLIQIKALEKDLELKNKELKDQSIEFHQAKNELSVHSDKIKQKFEFDLKEEVSAYEELMEKFAQKEKLLLEEIKDLKSQNFDKNSHVKKLDNTISEAQDVNSSLNKELEKKDKKNGEQEINIQNLKAIVDDKKTEVKRIWALLDEEKKEVSLRDNTIKEKDGEINKLSDKLDEAEKVYKRLNDEYEKEKRKKEESNLLAHTSTSSLKEKEEEIKKLASSFEQSQKDYNRMSNMYDSEKNKKEDMSVLAQASSSSLKEKEEEIKKLASSFYQSQQDYDRMNKMHEKEKEKNEELNLLVQTSSSALKEKEEDLEKLTRLKENFEVELKKLNNCVAKGEQGFYYKIEILKKEVQEKERLSADLQRKVNKYSSQSEINANELSKIGKMAEKLKVELTDKTGAFKAKEKEAKELKNEVELLNSRIAESENREERADIVARKAEVIDNLNKKIAALNKEIKNHHDEYSSAFEKESGEREKISSALAHKEQEVINLKAKTNTLEGELGELSEKWKFDSAQLQNAASHLRSANAEIEVSKAKISSLESELDNYKEMSTQSKEAMISLTDYGKKAENEKIAEISRVLKQEMEKYNDLLARFEKNNLTINELSAVKANLTSSLNKLTNENERLKTNVTVVEVSKDAEIKKLSQQMDRDEEGFRKKLERIVEEDRVRYQDLMKEMRDAAINLTHKETERYNDLLLRFEKSNLSTDELSTVKENLTNTLDNLTYENKRLKENLSSMELLKNAEIKKLSQQIDRDEEGFSKKLNRVVEEDKKRYQDLTKEMQNTTVNLTQKEMELQEAHSALSIIKGEYETIVSHEKEISEKYSKELSSENNMLEEARRKIESKEKESEKLLTIIKSLKDETFDIKKDYADVKASNAKLNLKGPKKTEKDNLLKKHEKELKKREGEIIKLHKQLDKSKIEKSELITHERDMKIAFSEKPYRRKIKEAERKLIEKEHRIQNLSLKLENIENEFKKLKSVQGATSDGYIKRSSGNLEDLVAGISHQISNSISIIRSHAEFCLETPEKQKIRESLEAIVRSIIGLQKKIEEISNFSRPGSMQRKTAYLEAVIKDAIVFLREREEFDNIKLTISCVKNLKPLKIDYVRLQEAIEYILLNAVEAMGGKGEVKIELKRVNKQQVIKISDKGCGIESRNLLTVFQPFFTTKPGKIGLGLAIAMNILNAHDGDIKINSELGLGTELILLVPEGK